MPYRTILSNLALYNKPSSENFKNYSENVPQKHVYNTYRYELHCPKKMKFTVTSVAKSGARIGCLSDIVRIPAATFETPLLLLHTRGGSVPHLSHDLLQMVSSEKHIIQLPLVTLYEYIKNIKTFSRGIADFAGLGNYLFYATIQDSGTTTPEGYHDKNSISLWTKGGRKLVDPNGYIQAMEALKPDFFQALSDGDSNVNSSAKRVKKSVDATVKFASTCALLKEQSEILKETPMLVSVSGGYNMIERHRCISLLKEVEPAGYVLDGFHTNGETAANLNWKDVRPVLTETLTALPKSKLRVFHGAFTPSFLLEIVSLGIDIVDATFPWLIAEKGGALVFPNSIPENHQLTETLPKISKKTPIETETLGENEEKKLDKEELPINRSYDIDLKNRVFFNDFKPLFEGCSCYSCRKYSRSYVHHLLNTGELLGPMLLMMHNLHHYLNFLATIRKAIKEDQLDALKTKLRDFVEAREDNKNRQT